jgi:16S rRNA (cytidine1402-2'-O)-methyltransferase
VGQLILVPTPLQDNTPLETVALEQLKQNCLDENVMILVEEHKVARRRWLAWGLPRVAIEKFILVNEHTQEKIKSDLIKEIKKGKTAYLMSDTGLPAFCDPGQTLVELAHRNNIKVSSTPFPNSIALAVALSGFPHNQFYFSGFIPVKEPDRKEWMKAELKKPEVLIWMETPYRLHKLLGELAEMKLSREIYLGLDLGGKSETNFRGSAEEFLKRFPEPSKREFVLLIGPLKN